MTLLRRTRAVAALITVALLIIAPGGALAKAGSAGQSGTTHSHSSTSAKSAKRAGAKKAKKKRKRAKHPSSHKRVAGAGHKRGEHSKPARKGGKKSKQRPGTRGDDASTDAEDPIVDEGDHEDSDDLSDALDGAADELADVADDGAGATDAGGSGVDGHDDQ